ncbi:hypothetical protein F4802DRAFT_599213 [Xylaria palmicola]|nr:hypothetical protein F4802DRAFT_599213 [Xylaria palmicola]
MQLYHYLLRAALIASALAALRDRRQVIVTVTAGVTPSLPSVPTAPSPVPLSAAPVPWEQPSGGGGGVPAPVPTGLPAHATPGASSASASASSGDLSLPPLPPSTASGVPAPVGSGTPGDAKCGKGYTYCGYMLRGSGHNFAQSDVEDSYCAGLPELCAGAKHKTSPDQAVFVCMSDRPSTVKLLCACSGTCLNNATTNYIAHCDEACVNV